MFKVTQHTDTSPTRHMVYRRPGKAGIYMRITLLDPRVLKAPTEYHHHVLPASGEQVLAFASDFPKNAALRAGERQLLDLLNSRSSVNDRTDGSAAA
jgi:environmental stress-induced protein Ves